MGGTHAQKACSDWVAPESTEPMQGLWQETPKPGTPCHSLQAGGVTICFERDYISIIFITVYCYNCSILLLVIFNPLLCIIYKLNFLIGVMCTHL